MRAILSMLRWVLAVALVLIAGLDRAVPAATLSPMTGTIVFDVMRGGRPMGVHRLDFHREGDRLIVDIAIDLEVRLIVPLYSYTHRSREIWVSGRLARIDTTTDDDGRKFRVAGGVEPAGFVVDSTAGRFIAPADLVPTSYWRERMLRSGPLFDTQEGRLIAASIVDLPDEVLTLGGQPVPARVYDVSGDLNMRLWYGADGRWLKLRFVARGSDIEYVLRRSDLSTALLSGER